VGFFIFYLGRHIWSDRNLYLDETVRDFEIDTSMNIVELAVGELANGDFELELPGWVESERNILPGRERDLEGGVRGFESDSRGDVLNRPDAGREEGLGGLEPEEEIMPTNVIFFWVIINRRWVSGR
jgi:hypothetical protein